MWAFQDTKGMIRSVKLPGAYYVPSCPIRLLSTTELLTTYQPEKIDAKTHQMTLSGVLEGVWRWRLAARRESNVEKCWTAWSLLLELEALLWCAAAATAVGAVLLVVASCCPSLGGLSEREWTRRCTRLDNALWN